MPNDNAINNPQDFEQSIKELEAILTKMEQGQISLSDSLAQYEQGIKLIRQCQGALDKAEQTIENLNQTTKTNDENPTTE